MKEGSLSGPRGIRLAVGFFDGVHLGHRRILSGTDAVLTFRSLPPPNEEEDEDDGEAFQFALHAELAAFYRRCRLSMLSKKFKTMSRSVASQSMRAEVLAD